MDSKNTRIQKAEKIFNDFNAQKLELLGDFYASDVHFQDSVHEMHGLEALKNYYAKMYKNVTAIEFIFSKWVCEGDSCVGAWTMKLKAKGLNGGSEVSVDGISLLVFNGQDKVSYHRDYFDMGAFIYEHIPVLKKVILFIKNQLK